MAQAKFCFYGELNDFLPLAQRGQWVGVSLNGVTVVKHLIEALGVPHPEVDWILAGGQPVAFGYAVQDGDRIEVYPVDAGAPRNLLRPPLNPPVRFVLDTHLGQLATYLRLLGFDTLYRNDYDDAELAVISSQEVRVLLTRDRGLLKRKAVVYGYCVRTSQPRQQLIDVLRRYRLSEAIQPWRRCLRCNGLLVPAEKAAILAHLEPKTQRYYEEFQRCVDCGQIYWQGSHHSHMQTFIAEILRELKLL
jgi:uncharacterized protein with PIN domain